ncbi:MAG: 50S ribosomal protein L2 [Parcubacteria group bacterium]|nr:50S ribosomal protein L2 [Parcubacteria group bacterium]
MAIKRYKPTTPGRRKSSVNTTKDLTQKRPEKSLRVIKKRKAGRSRGRIAVRHRGGGAKRFIRIIDFKRTKFDVPATVTAVEYDPNRGAHIMLLQYEDGEKRYSLAPQTIKEGDKVISSEKEVDLTPGNRTKLKNIPVGLDLHDIELQPGAGSRMVRGAGGSARLRALEGKYALIKLPSGEIRKVLAECSATLGQVSNPDHNLVRYGKAGRTRHRGFRPTVRGKVMNPCDHPHGGGEGSTSIGMTHPKTPWGKHALGVRTRKSKKFSNKFIVKRRYHKGR